MTTRLDPPIREIVGDADSLAELEMLTDKAGGLLMAEAVLEAARNAASPLHKHFEWNDSVAGEAWRREQARSLVRSYELHIVEAEQETRVRYFTSVVNDGGRAYRRTEEVLQVADLREKRRLEIRRELVRLHGELTTWDRLGSESPVAVHVGAAIEAIEKAAPVKARR